MAANDWQAALDPCRLRPWALTS